MKKLFAALEDALNRYSECHSYRAIRVNEQRATTSLRYMLLLYMFFGASLLIFTLIANGGTVRTAIAVMLTAAALAGMVTPYAGFAIEALGIFALILYNAAEAGFIVESSDRIAEGIPTLYMVMVAILFMSIQVTCGLMIHVRHESDKAIGALQQKRREMRY